MLARPLALAASLLAAVAFAADGGIQVTHSGGSDLNVSGSSLFVANVPKASAPGLVWSVDGVPGGNRKVGTLKGQGARVLYLAPAAPGTHTVTATHRAGAGSAALTIQPTAFKAPDPAVTVNVKDEPYGAKGDGVTNDTAAIQRAISFVAGSGGTVRIPDGTYMIDVRTLNRQQGLMITRGDLTLSLSPKAVLRAIPNSNPVYYILYLYGARNVNIIGGTLRGDREEHTVVGNPGESGMGLGITGSSGVTVQGLTVEQCWGDGIYVTGKNSNITLCGIHADRNRRQGLTITGADGMVVRDSLFENTSGTNPQNGLDVEPNPGETVANLEVFNCVFRNNTGGGIQSGPAAANDGRAFFKDSIFCHNTLTGNATWGIEMEACDGITLADNVITGTQGHGIVVWNKARRGIVTGNKITGSTKHGVSIADCEGTEVSGNKISGNKGHGINEAPGSGAVIKENRVVENGS